MSKQIAANWFPGLDFLGSKMPKRTNEPPMAALWICDAMDTSFGSTALISAVGASKRGLTSTNPDRPARLQSLQVQWLRRPAAKHHPMLRDRTHSTNKECTSRRSVHSDANPNLNPDSDPACIRSEGTSTCSLFIIICSFSSLLCILPEFRLHLWRIAPEPTAWET